MSVWTGQNHNSLKALESLRFLSVYKEVHLLFYIRKKLLRFLSRENVKPVGLRQQNNLVFHVLVKQVFTSDFNVETVQALVPVSFWNAQYPTSLGSIEVSKFGTCLSVCTTETGGSVQRCCRCEVCAEVMGTGGSARNVEWSWKCSLNIIKYIPVGSRSVFHRM